MRPSLLALLLSALALAFAGVGCGGSDGGAAAGDESAASVVPASAVAYISVNTDLESAQWEQAKELADKFPGRDRAVQAILKELGEEGVQWERDVEPALGPELAIVVLMQGDEPRVVGLTQPDDEEKLKALAAKGDEPGVTRAVGDWWAVAEKAADIDVYERARDDGEPLADDDTYAEAVADLPDEAVASFFVDGEPLQAALDRAGEENPFAGYGRLLWASGALEAVDEGAKMAGTVKFEGLGPVGDSYTPKLLERVPAGSLAVMSFRNLAAALEQIRSNEIAREFLPEAERMLGVTLTELADLFRGEAVLYARQGAPIPEVSLALEVDDPAEAMSTVDSLVARVAPLVEGRTGATTVEGVAAKYLEVRGVRLTYATFDGLLFLTSGPNGLAQFRGAGDKIGDDDAFARTKEAAGLGDETSGFMYVNLRDAIGLIMGFAGVSGERIPPDVGANLAPLDTFLAQSSKEGGEIDYTAFLGIR